MTFEMEKVQTLFPGAELILRLAVDDSGSLMRFSSKFGASMVQVGAILTRALELQLTIVGLSFHIGSGCFEPEQYHKAIYLARCVSDLAMQKGLPRFTCLDIGGGFPGNSTGSSFETFAVVIAESVAKYFPSADLQVIAEPGRYFTTDASTLFTLVQGKRQEDARFLYYVNDGVYGSFNNVMFDHSQPVPSPVDEFLGGQESGRVRSLSTIFGPTCDSIDTITTDCLVRELSIGEWLAFPSMGAYTTAAASTFNGIPRPRTQYVLSLAP